MCHRHFKTDAQSVMGTLGLMHNVMCHMHYKTEAQNVTGMLRLMHKVSQALQD